MKDWKDKILGNGQVKGFLIKGSTFWPYLISKFLITYKGVAAIEATEAVKNIKALK